MSDFDKEAEREKLRKKFEQDRKKRESTQRMSELLLKGATMTNRHCETCGDPLFRHNDQEFCATCNSAGRAETDAGGEQTADDEQTSEPQTGDRTPERAVDERAVDEQTADERVTETHPSGGRTERGDTGRGHTGRSAGADAAAGEPGADASASVPSTVDADARPGVARDATNAPPAAGDLGDARESLIRTITRYSRAAEQTDDPRRAKELLAAAREAAETLAALS